MIIFGAVDPVAGSRSPRRYLIRTTRDTVCARSLAKCHVTLAKILPEPLAKLSHLGGGLLCAPGCHTAEELMKSLITVFSSGHRNQFPMLPRAYFERNKDNEKGSGQKSFSGCQAERHCRQWLSLCPQESITGLVQILCDFLDIEVV